jgi:hypothetical protein
MRMYVTKHGQDIEVVEVVGYTTMPNNVGVLAMCDLVNGDHVFVPVRSITVK